MEVAIIVVTAIILLLVALCFQRPDARLPPFPVRPLPVVGNLHNLRPNTRDLFKKWSDQCGNIFSLYMAGTLMVVLNGYDLMKEAFVKRADIFSDRPSFFIDQVTGYQGKGVILTSGETWKEQRAVTMSIIRKLGLGKNSLAPKIKEEISYFMDSLANLKGQATNIAFMTNMSVSNIICSIMFGHRFDYDDEVFKSLLVNLRRLALEQQSVSLVNFIPWLQHLPGDLFRAKRLASSSRALFTSIKNLTEAEKIKGSNSADVDNFVVAYMAELDKKSAKGLHTTMDEMHLIKLIYELFAAGTESTSTTLNWIALYLILYPNIQENLYKESEDVIGSSIAPDILDMPKMVYTNAFIMEVQRYTSLVPLAVTHLCSEDTTLGGFMVPKGALIVPNLDSVLLDEKIWGADVKTFKPERFIDTAGQLIKTDHLIPFGIGSRICLGENLAKMELFLFVSSLIQRFRFLPEKDGCTPSDELDFGFTVSPKPFQVRLIERRAA